ncbi:hypothetical protein Patl1_24089 [Pistacia atlantica]|uniref:Uncharacterized protein n=1 Tax=Pistacia atlantica TaxID=434234 RepID=A0ACC0ZVL6_9ROSI|nr:hypothetical protein Patl1_24089 [Pistacia atlantica]
MATSRLLLSHRRFTRSPPHAPPFYNLLHATLPPPEPSESSYFGTRRRFSFLPLPVLVDDDTLTDSVPIPAEIVNFCDGEIGSGEESILPVQTLISVLEAYHSLSGFPW